MRHNLEIFPITTGTYRPRQSCFIHRPRPDLTLLLGKVAWIRRFARPFLAMALLLLVGCSGGGDSSASLELVDGDYSFSQPLAQVEAEIDELIVVPVNVNGQPARFILDTGADTFIVSETLAGNLNLEKTGTITVNTVAGRSEAPIVELDRLELGNVAVEGASALVQNIGGFDGAIGASFLRHVTVVVSYFSIDGGGAISTPGGELEFGDPRSVSISALSTSALAQGGPFDPGIGGRIIETSVPAFDTASIEGFELGQSRIDTGNNGGLTISGGLAREIAASKQQTIPVSLAASNGSIAGTAFIASSVVLEGEELSDQYSVSVDSPLGDKAGDRVLVGSLVLRQYSWVFDLPHSQVWLRRDRPLRYALDSSGS
jgi:clan AA aspartic protease (TIGR02281 family)